MTQAKDTHREKASLNMTTLLTKSMNMDILTLKQNFQKNKFVTGKTPFFVIEN